MNYFDEYDDQEWVMAQGVTDYVLPIQKQHTEKYGDMLVILTSEEAVYITKSQAMKFFNLVEKS